MNSSIVRRRSLIGSLRNACSLIRINAARGSPTQGLTQRERRTCDDLERLAAELELAEEPSLSGAAALASCEPELMPRPPR